MRVLRLNSWSATAALALALTCACNGGAAHPVAASPAGSGSATSAAAATATGQLGAPATTAAPPAEKTGGFDGAKAYAQTQKLVSFGPRPPNSDAIHRTQDYITSQLRSFGCTVDSDDFTARTPPNAIVPMKNIVAKIPGTGQGIILLLTHYDTLRLDNFVGAEDGGSSSGLMLEMARLLCAQKAPQPNAVWIAFLDGEEAQVVQNGQAQWADDLSDSVYGSREMAARMAVSGDLKRVKAIILADMIGQYNLRIERDSTSTGWLTALVWKKAADLGYQNVFVSAQTSVEDDHSPFLQRSVPSVDIIDLDGYSYWHTTQDTMDKVSPASLAIVGHVILESVKELQKR